MRIRKIMPALMGGLVGLAIVIYTRLPKDQLPHGAVRMKITCVNNLKQLGLAFRTWGIDHDGQFPFNVSTNAGGSRELCGAASDGVDTNAALHFQVLARGTELLNPHILICPKDRVKKPAPTFDRFYRENLTYCLRTGTNVSETNPKELLLVCPIDGNTLYCDGSVVESKQH